MSGGPANNEGVLKRVATQSATKSRIVFMVFWNGGCSELFCMPYAKTCVVKDLVI